MRKIVGNLPWVRSGNSTEYVDDDGEDKDQNRNMTISNFTQRKVQQNVIWHYLISKSAGERRRWVFA